MIWNGAAVTLHRASTAHAAEVLDVLDEAAAWLRRRGVTQWPERFESSWIEGAIERGETWLARLGATAMGTLTLDWSDPLWADIGGAAGYVHRMAVRRQAVGLGALLLGWAADVARREDQARGSTSRSQVVGAEGQSARPACDNRWHGTARGNSIGSIGRVSNGRTRRAAYSPL
jgi:hypothetical protein